MSRNLVLLQVLADGTTQEFSLEQLQVVKAQINAKYVMLDAETGKAQDLVLQQHGDDAQLTVDGEHVATIEGYYEDAMAAEVITDDGVARLNDALIRAGEDIVGASSGDLGYTWTATEIASAVILAPLSIAAVNSHIGGGSGGDNTAPAPPTGDLNSDTGVSAEDAITSDVVMNITNLEEEATWEFSLDAGETFTEGVGTSFNLENDTTYAIGDIQVRQTDKAGNVSETSINLVEITTDNTAPDAPGVDALVTTDTSPTITGTATLAAGETLSVTVGGATYDNVDATGGVWSIDTGVVAPDSGSFTAFVEGSTNEVVATITDTAGNSTSDASSNEITVTDTSVVVFDMVNGQSSDHSGRAFDGATTYTIYLMVDSTSGALSAPTQWTGGENLGSDDSIVLIGSGAAIQGPASAVVSMIGGSTNFVSWFETGVATVAFLNTSGVFTRNGPTATNNVTLWSASTSLSFGPVSNHSFATTLPAGVMTSQGLV